MYHTFRLRTGYLKLIAALLLLLIMAAVAAAMWPGGEDIQPSAALNAGNTLVIDPGHGGQDGGAVGPNGAKESDINLAVALKLRALAEFYGKDNIMTRQDDRSLSAGESYSEHEDLVARAQVVNSASDPVLISIHQNCYPTGQPSGPQVLYSSNGSSERLGRLTHQNLILSLDPMSRRVAEPASDKLYVLNNVSCPAILVECGFMSNNSDLEKLGSGAYQTRLASVLMASFLQYTSGLSGA